MRIDIPTPIARRSAGIANPWDATDPAAMDALMKPTAEGAATSTPPVASSGGGAAPGAAPVPSEGFQAPNTAAPVPSDGVKAPQPGLGGGGPAPPQHSGGHDAATPEHSTGFLAPPSDKWMLGAAEGGQPIDTGGATVPMDGSTNPNVPLSGGGPAPPQSGGQPPPAKESPAMAALRAKDAAFARAKDQIGQTMRTSLTALRENLSGRGGLGGGQETGGMAALIGEGANTLSDVVTNQAAYDVGTQNQAANQRYAGALTKRGQDLGVTQSILSLLGSQAY